MLLRLPWLISFFLSSPATPDPFFVFISGLEAGVGRGLGLESEVLLLPSLSVLDSPSRPCPPVLLLLSILRLTLRLLLLLVLLLFLVVLLLVSLFKAMSSSNVPPPGPSLPAVCHSSHISHINIKWILQMQNRYVVTTNQSKDDDERDEQYYWN